MVCPATIIGSMDAVDVDPEDWKPVALEMALTCRVAVDLFSIEEGGGWTKRGRLNADGSVA